MLNDIKKAKKYATLHAYVVDFGKTTNNVVLANLTITDFITIMEVINEVEKN